MRLHKGGGGYPVNQGGHTSPEQPWSPSGKDQEPKMTVLSSLIMVFFSINLSINLSRKIEMQEDIKEEAALKVLDFSDDVDNAPDESGNYTWAFIPLD